MFIKFRWPITFIPKWKHDMIIYAKKGELLMAVKALMKGKNLTIKEAKDIWEEKYRDKYFKLRK